MPIKGQSPKQIVHTELHKFKYGNLHSGSKHGPLVKSRKQAIAIALSESGQSNKKAAGGRTVRDYVRKYAEGGLTQYSGKPQRYTRPEIGRPSMTPETLMSGRNPNQHYDDADRAALIRPDNPVMFPWDRSWDKLHGKESIDDITGQNTYAEGGSADDEAAMMPETYVNPLAKAIVGGTAQGLYNIPKNFVEGSQESMEGGISPYSVSPKSAAGAGELVMQGVGNAAGVRPAGAGVAGVFVGPYGAHMLRDADRTALKPHPVIGEEINQRAKNLRPEFQDIYKGAAQDMRDAEARGILDMRTAQGPTANDRDIWARSGWHIGEEGVPIKEIPDTGAKLSHSGYNEEGKPTFRLDHPAGDFHKIYDIPHFTFNENIKPGMASTTMDNHGRILEMELGGKPTKANIKASVSPAIHEIQHPIQAKEGMAGGSSPRRIEAGSPEYMQEYFPGYGDKRLAFQPQANEAQTKTMKKSPEVMAAMREPDLAHSRAAFQAYSNAAGEVQARNAQARRAESYLYQKHPRDTADVPSGMQHIDTRLMPRQYIKGEEGMAGGGSVSNFNPERGEAFGLAQQGLIKSEVPGRTDKLNLNVPNGSYVIPADIPGAIGQGNTIAGGAILDKMFKSGPYGMNLMKGVRGSRGHQSHMRPLKFARGGGPDHMPIVAAGGEYLVHPNAVAHLGAGSLEAGHSILDAFVKHVRSKHINTLKGLKPPKGSSK